MKMSKMNRKRKTVDDEEAATQPKRERPADAQPNRMLAITNYPHWQESESEQKRAFRAYLHVNKIFQFFRTKEIIDSFMLRDYLQALDWPEARLHSILFVTIDGMAARCDALVPLFAGPLFSENAPARLDCDLAIEGASGTRYAPSMANRITPVKFVLVAKDATGATSDVDLSILLPFLGTSGCFYGVDVLGNTSVMSKSTTLLDSSVTLYRLFGYTYTIDVERVLRDFEMARVLSERDSDAENTKMLLLVGSRHTSRADVEQAIERRRLDLERSLVAKRGASETGVYSGPLDDDYEEVNAFDLFQRVIHADRELEVPSFDWTLAALSEMYLETYLVLLFDTKFNTLFSNTFSVVGKHLFLKWSDTVGIKQFYSIESFVRPRGFA